MRDIGQGPEQKLVFLWSRGASPPYIYPNMNKCSPTQKFSKSYSSEVFMQGSLHRDDKLLTQSPTFLSTPRIRYGDLKFQASNHGLVFLVISLQPEAIKETIKSNPIRTKDTPITQELPRDLEALCQEPESKIKYSNKRCSHHLYYFRKLQRFQKLWPGAEDKDHIHISYKL